MAYYLTILIIFAANFIVLSASTLKSESLQTQTVTLAGTVRNTNGILIRGAQVTAQNTGGNNEIRTTVTNGEGRYTISGLSPGKYKVKAEVSGFAVKNAEATLSVGEVVSLDFVMDAGVEPVTGSNLGKIKGSVQSTQSQPIVNAKITITRILYGEKFDILTDKNGLYEQIGLKPGRYAIKAEATTYISNKKTTTLGPRGVRVVDFKLNPTH